MNAFSVVIAAAGRGSRMGGVDKALLPVAETPLLSHCLSCFACMDEVVEIVVAGRPALLPALRNLMSVYPISGRVVAGGHTRRESVYRGLDALECPAELIAVHDVARPLVTPRLTRKVVSAAASSGAAAPAIALSDTVKKVHPGSDRASEKEEVASTLSRQFLRRVQTPQVFSHNLLLEAHRSLDDVEVKQTLTDDASMVEVLGHPVYLVKGQRSNLKITTWHDKAVAEALYKAGQGSNVTRRSPGEVFRCGVGYDIHRFGDGGTLKLGGVQISDSPQLEGHSDADALLHSVTDALLGACSLGDIGHHFPPGDPEFADACSTRLLLKTENLVRESGYEPCNVDVTVIAETPRLSSHVDAMRENLADTLSLPLDCVSVKATTSEGLGPVGEGKAIASLAVCTVTK